LRSAFNSEPGEPGPFAPKNSGTRWGIYPQRPTGCGRANSARNSARCSSCLLECMMEPVLLETSNLPDGRLLSRSPISFLQRRFGRVSCNAAYRPPPHFRASDRRRGLLPACAVQYPSASNNCIKTPCFAPAYLVRQSASTAGGNLPSSKRFFLSNSRRLNRRRSAPRKLSFWGL
jgi:predicted acylesterase/phospholipase RssA